MIGIITNPAANQAQKNLALADGRTETSIGRLSSGKRIIRASDDVAGLAVGTILMTNISTMKAALTNAAQASSLLSIADGALDNTGQILQRQKALAAQATSGSLNDAAREFLNLEFQNLKQQIDQIATATNFNGIKLLDGSLFNAAKMTTDTRTTATSAQATLGFITLADGKVIKFFDTAAQTPAGYSTVTFTSKADTKLSAFPNNLREFDGTGTAADAAANFMLMVEGLRKYTGSDANTLTARKAVSAFHFSRNGTNITIQAKSAGTVWSGVDINSDDDVTLGGKKLGGTAQPIGGEFGIYPNDGPLAAGVFAQGGATAYSGGAIKVWDPATSAIAAAATSALVPSVYAQGSVSDSILRPISTTTVADTGVNFADISNNPAFVGKMPQFIGTYVEDNSVNLEVTVGGIKYIASAVSTSPGAHSLVTFYSEQSGFGSFTLQFANGQGMDVTNQTQVDTFVARINKALEKVDIYQRREITSFVPAGTVYPTGSNTSSGNLSGSRFWLINNEFNDIKIEDVKVKAPATGATQAVITFVINGEEFRSGYNYDGSVLALNTTITNTGGGNNDGRIGFVSQTNPNRVLVWGYGSTTNLDISNNAEAEGLEKALKQAFNIGTGEGGAGLKFQVGTTANEAIDVQISSTRSKNIYLDGNNNFMEIKISNQKDAEVANNILDNAINIVVAVRAQVGALQSRFDYAQANIRSSIENQDAARSLFLDTDVSTESTELAQAQVRLQASISVLAQANQLPQVLLKLIG